MRRSSAPFDPDPPVPPCTARGIRHKLLERVADVDATHVTIRAGDGVWQRFCDGVQIKVLNEREGVLSYLLRLSPGAKLPAHRHRLDEECVVLEGTLWVGRRIEVGPGDFHLAYRGSLHASLRTDAGATIFLRGAVPDPGDVLG